MTCSPAFFHQVGQKVATLSRSDGDHVKLRVSEQPCGVNNVSAHRLQKERNKSATDAGQEGKDESRVDCRQGGVQRATPATSDKQYPRQEGTRDRSSLKTSEVPVQLCVGARWFLGQSPASFGVGRPCGRTCATEQAGARIASPTQTPHRRKFNNCLALQRGTPTIRPFQLI